MRKAIGIAFSLCMLSSITLPLLAQDSILSENRFLLTGYGFATYADPEETDGSFATAFVPIFLYRVSDRFLFEAEVEFEFEDDAVEVGVEYAQIDWLATDNMTVVMGKFLTPFGTFVEKLHPAWINKLPTFPLPYQHGQSVVPFGQFGLQLRGGVPFGDGNRRFTYSVYLSNGLQVSTHGHEEEENPEGGEGHEEVAGMSQAALNEALGGDEGNDEGEEHEDNDPIFFDTASVNGNGSLGVGGRVGVIPIRGFEVGLSYLNASYDEFGDLDTTSYGIDFLYHHDLFDVRGEWINTETERGFGPDGDVLANQDMDSWYLQPSLRLSVIPVYFFNRMEVVARFANLDWGEGDKDQTSLGLNYYFTPSSILRLAWERIDDVDVNSADSVIAMFAIGF